MNYYTKNYILKKGTTEKLDWNFPTRGKHKIMFVPLISLTFDLATRGKYKIMSMFKDLFNHLEREHICKYVLEENCISLKEFFM